MYCFRTSMFEGKSSCLYSIVLLFKKMVKIVNIETEGVICMSNSAILMETTSIESSSFQ
jgi:hypothetical protein